LSPRTWTASPLTVLFSLSGLLRAEDPPKPPEPPVIRMAVPLGIQPSSTAKFTIRGQRLEGATEVVLTAPGAVAKVLESGKAVVPNGQNAARVGDTQVVVEVTTPAHLGRPPLAFIVKTPTGESAPYPMLSTPGTVEPEKEPNDGFKQAQPLTIPATIDGLVERNQDVDVYRITGTAGQRLRAEIRAWRQGSGLDAWLTLFDAHGQQIGSIDDLPAGNDPILEATLPADGSFYLIVSDALDQGGPGHPYRLTVEVVDADSPR